MQLKEWESVEKLLLESDEAKEKGLFRQYTSTIIKDVRLLCAMYKKDNLYLADVGKEITHRIQFEL